MLPYPTGQPTFDKVHGKNYTYILKWEFSLWLSIGIRQTLIHVKEKILTKNKYNFHVIAWI